MNPKCERAAELKISAGLDTKRRRLSDAAPTKIADRGGDAHLPANDEVERRGASPASNEGTLSQSSTPSLAQRRRGPRVRSNRLLDGATVRPQTRLPIRTTEET